RGAVADRVLERVPRQVSAHVSGRAEPHESVAVPPVDRRARQTEQKSVRQSLTHLLPEVAFLRAVGFVHHRNAVVARIEHAGSLTELVDRSDYDLPGTLAQERLQLRA